MGWQIVHDQETHTALLVDPAGPWALGPCLVGPAASETLLAFVEGLDQDPAELTTWEMASIWQTFLAVMGTIEPGGQEEAAEAVSEPPTAPEEASGGPLPSQSPEPVADVALHNESLAEHRSAIAEEGRLVPTCSNCNAQRWVMGDAGPVCGVCGVAQP